jgi:hypothetical protein
MLIDCHAHLTAEAVAADLDTVLGRAQAAGVGGVLVAGEDLADDQRVANLVARRSASAPVLLPCFGLHPDRFAEDNPPRAAQRARQPHRDEGLHRFGSWCLGRARRGDDDRQRPAALPSAERGDRCGVVSDVRGEPEMNTHALTPG